MSDSTPSSSNIHAQRVPELKRIGTLSKHFATRAVRWENAVFYWMRTLSPIYTGAYWHFYELSNGDFYMAPDLGKLPLLIDSNGFDDILSADAAGITACLFAYSHCSLERNGAQFARYYHAMHDYACAHPESRLILEAID